MLNVTFREDDCRIRDSTAVRNFVLLRKIGINLVARDRSTKASLQGKRKKAAWNTATCSNLLKAISYVSHGSFAFELRFALFPESIQTLLIVATIVHNAPEPLNSFEQLRRDRPCAGEQPQFLLHHGDAQG